MTTLAALDHAVLLVEMGESRPLAQILPAVTVDKLFAVMDELSIDVLHIHRAALPVIGLPLTLKDPRHGERRPDHPFVADVTFRGERVNQRALSPSIKCGRREILIGAYQSHGYGDPFAEAGSARQLLAAHIAFRDAFVTDKHPGGFAYKNSAQTTGSQLMHAPWRKRRGAPDLRAPYELPKLDGVLPGTQVELPYIWTRAADVQPARHKYVAAWDINWQRLSACSGLPLGIGGIEERPGTSFDKRLPGYHFVRAIGPLPQATFVAPPIMVPGWHATPLVAMALELGIPIAVERSYAWTEHKRYLDPFYQTMRDARAKLLLQVSQRQGWQKFATLLALAALKPCYLQPFGALRSVKARDEQSIYYRPHWYDTIISSELARQYRTMHALARLQVPILAVYFDTIIIETDTPDEPPEPITVSPQLGKYKPVGALGIHQARATLYPTDGRPKPGHLIKKLKGER